MDYRARGSWIGNVRGRLGKERVTAETLVYWFVYLALWECVAPQHYIKPLQHEYDSHSMHTFQIDRGIITYCIHLFYSDSSLLGHSINVQNEKWQPTSDFSETWYTCTVFHTKRVEKCFLFIVHFASFLQNQLSYGHVLCTMVLCSHAMMFY